MLVNIYSNYFFNLKFFPKIFDEGFFSVYNFFCGKKVIQLVL